LPVEIVDDGGKKKHSADPPAQIPDRAGAHRAIPEESLLPGSATAITGNISLVVPRLDVITAEFGRVLLHDAHGCGDLLASSAGVLVTHAEQLNPLHTELPGSRGSVEKNLTDLQLTASI
jgi:hypothetical protein